MFIKNGEAHITAMLQAGSSVVGYRWTALFCCLRFGLSHGSLLAGFKLVVILMFLLPLHSSEGTLTIYGLQGKGEQEAAMSQLKKNRQFRIVPWLTAK